MEERFALLLCLLGVPAVAAGQPSGSRRHWAFERVERPAAPVVSRAGWARNPIDLFIAAEHEKRGLLPECMAGKAALIRRATVDLTGLPPTREDLHLFLADSSDDAYERVVDRLLGSPRYGERWGRHWMDVWRYSDWYGRRAVPDVMNSYPQIWRWRDWIVRSLNEDKGYDRMVLDMLAADEASPEDLASLPATGFLVRNWYKWNYNVWMKDVVEHTGKAFLGLTFNCAHCHDHKYDPITQEDYFKLRAFFEPLELRHDRLPREPDPGPFKKYVYAESYGPISSGMVRVFDEKLDAVTVMYSGGDARNKIEGRPPVEPGVPGALGGPRLDIRPIELPAMAFYPGLQPFVEEETIAACERDRKAAGAEMTLKRKALDGLEERARSAGGGAQAPGQAELNAAKLAFAVAEARSASAEARLESAQARVAADRAKYGLAGHGPTGDTAVLSRKEGSGGSDVGDALLLAQAACRAERTAKLREAEEDLLKAEEALASSADSKEADAARKKEARVAESRAGIEAARQALEKGGSEYTPLSPLYPSRSTGRRLALARWITSRENPLAARVAVNHIWMRHFQRPLVESVFDFGRNGKQPSHPELLDWLAAELMDSGWRMKAIHRLIVTSSTYRMSAAGGLESPSAALDPDNRWLWRANSRRLEAEAVRDGLLSAAGEIDLALGGPEIDTKEGLVSRRRSLYFAHHGEATMQFLEIFDAANPCDSYRRAESIAPQQALGLENSEFSLAMARSLCRKLSASLGSSSGPDFIAAAFEAVLARGPSQEEVAASQRFLERQAQVFRSAVSAPSPVSPGVTLPAAGPDLRAREGLVHALFNHNDFITVR